MNSHLEDVYYGPFSRQPMKQKLSGEVPTSGLVLMILPPESLQKELAASLEARVELGELPRLAIADEDHPIRTSLQSQVTTVHYQHSGFGQLPFVTPVDGQLDIHLFGLFSSDTLSEEIERFIQGMAVSSSSLHKVRIHLQPRFLFQEGLSPQHAVSRRARSAAALAGFQEEIFGDVSLNSSVQMTGSLSQGAVFRATHETSVELEILVDKFTSAP